MSRRAAMEWPEWMPSTWPDGLPRAVRRGDTEALRGRKVPPLPGLPRREGLAPALGAGRLHGGEPDVTFGANESRVDFYFRGRNDEDKQLEERRRRRHRRRVRGGGDSGGRIDAGVCPRNDEPGGREKHGHQRKGRRHRESSRCASAHAPE